MTAIYSKSNNVFTKSFFSPCGDAVVGIDRDGDIYCYRCIPTNKSGECEADFTINTVEQGTMLGQCCSECGTAIEARDIISLDTFLSDRHWHLTEASDEDLEELYNGIFVIEDTSMELSDYDDSLMLYDCNVWSLIDNYLMAGVEISKILDLILYGEIEIFYSRETDMYYHTIIA